MKNQQECLKALVEGEVLHNTRKGYIARFDGGFLRIFDKTGKNISIDPSFSDYHLWEVKHKPKNLYAYRYSMVLGGKQVNEIRHYEETFIPSKNYERASEYDMEVLCIQQ